MVDAVDAMVMRSVYLHPSDDACLRQLALEVGTTKSALVRAALAESLKRWGGPGGKALYRQDAEEIRRSREDRWTGADVTSPR